jgi:hypothetical protein
MGTGNMRTGLEQRFLNYIGLCYVIIKAISPCLWSCFEKSLYGSPSTALASEMVFWFSL